MSLAELLVLAAGLAMDAFAAAVCKGLAMGDASLKKCCTVGLWFGGFQALMPLVGYLLGRQFSSMIEGVSAWISFVLLVLIGANMLHEAFERDEKADAALSAGAMLVLALATSIDAMAVGVTFAALSVNVPLAVALTGGITFILSAVGVKVGNIFGMKYRMRAELAGGIALIILGLKLLLGHLGAI